MNDALGQQFLFTLEQAQGGLAQQQAKNAAQALNQKSGAPKNLEQIEKTAKEFEAVFISEMLKPMFDGIKTDGTFGGGKGEEIFRGFMVTEYGKLLAETGGIGIADQVKAEMIRIQEAKPRDGFASNQNVPSSAQVQDLDFEEIVQ